MNKKNRNIQKKIAQMVAAGKPLGGLLAGMMASAAMAGSTTNAVPRLAGVPLPGKPARVAVETNQCRQVKEGYVRGRKSPARPMKLTTMGEPPARPVKTPEAPKTQKKKSSTQK